MKDLQLQCVIVYTFGNATGSESFGWQRDGQSIQTGILLLIIYNDIIYILTHLCSFGKSMQYMKFYLHQLAM